LSKEEAEKLMKKHRANVAALEGTLAEEQKRQMAAMRERVTARHKDSASQRVQRQIKMAAVQKSKAKQRAAASVVIGLEDEADVARQAALAKCVSKVSHLKRVIYKSAFSQTPDLPRRIAERNLDLAKRLDGHDPLAFLLDVEEPSLDAAELEQLQSAR